MPRKTIPSYRPTRNPQNPEKTVFVPVRSHLWSEVGLDSFRKVWDVLLDYYCEPFTGKSRLIDETHLGWWTRLNRMFWKSEAFTLREVEDRYGIAPATFTSYIDRLEDVELLDRERCIDLRGQPVDLLIRTPYPPARFLQQRERLLERVNTKDEKGRTVGHTALNRKQLGGSKAEGYPSRFLSVKERMKRIQAQARDANLAKMQEVIDHVIYVNVGRDNFTEKAFVTEVKRMCLVWTVYYDDRLLRDAIGQYRNSK
jgi:hypothetical protein